MRFRKSMVTTLLALGLGGVTPARAEVVPVVSANSSVTTLSKDQIADIFLGRASRFPNGELAVPIDQMTGSEARNAFYAKFTGKSPAQLKAYWSKIIFTGRGLPPPAVASDGEVKQRLVDNPHAIGYIENTTIDGRVGVLQ